MIRPEEDKLARLLTWITLAQASDLREPMRCEQGDGGILVPERATSLWNGEYIYLACPICGATCDLHMGTMIQFRMVGELIERMTEKAAQTRIPSVNPTEGSA